MPPAKQILQTILFADIAESSRLYESLGDARALSLVSACLEKINVTVFEHQGKVVKTIGDEVMCVFNSPDQAAAAAVCMHEAVSSDSCLTPYHLRLRIGLHHGSAISEDGDYFGDAVNTAARMVAQAKAGQIITNRSTLELMSPDRHSTARLVDQTRVKGKQETFDLFELSWGQPEEQTMVTTRVGEFIEENQRRYARLTIEYGGQSFEVNQIQPVITMGRDPTNHVVVEDPKVSRLHARIEKRRDRFFLVDQSTNGTYLVPGNGEMIMLRRDEAGLTSTGRLSLGEPVSPSSPHIITYKKND